MLTQIDTCSSLLTNSICNHHVFGVIVYDICSRESFDNIKEWLKEVDVYSTNDDAVKLLVGNKVDMVCTHYHTVDRHII
jgi:GTPase SAR1 family protein